MKANPLVELTLARLRSFAREPSAVFWTFGFPILLTMALGIAFKRQGPPKDAVAVVAGDGAAQTVRALEAHLTVKLLPEAQAADALKSGQVALEISRPEDSAVVYRFDPERPESRSARQLADDLLQRSAGRNDPLHSVDEKVEAPGSRYIDWLVPGLLGMQLMSGSLWGVAFGIVETRQRKLLKRLVATPMRRSDYLLSFMLSRLVFVLLETPLLLGFAHFAFGVALRGSLLGIFAISLFGAAAFAGISLLCASRAQNTETANGLVNLATLPMIILCGVFFSANRFPESVRSAIHFLPLTALNEALRSLINDGASVVTLGAPVAVMAAWGIACFAIALRIFRWT